MPQEAQSEGKVPFYRKAPTAAEIERREAAAKRIDEHRAQMPPLTTPTEVLVWLGRAEPVRQMRAWRSHGRG